MLAALFLHLGYLPPTHAQSGAISYVSVPGGPFSAVASPDGQWVFASSRSGLAVLHKTDGQWAVARTIPFNAGGGLSITHDGKILVVAAIDNVVFADVDKLISGQPNSCLGYFTDGNGTMGFNGPRSFYSAVSPDDRFAFIADENQETVTVVDLQAVRRQGASQAAVVGRIPVGYYPNGLVFSPDGRSLYSISEEARETDAWPTAPNNQGPGSYPATLREGQLVVIDVHKAETDPAHSVLARVPAGWCTVRVAISPDGRFVYATARSSNTVNVLDTHKFFSDPWHALVESVPVGVNPVGIVVVNHGSRIIVSDSNRFREPNENQMLSVLDTSKLTAGSKAVLETIPAGAYPDNLSLMPDGKTLLVANIDSNTVEFADISHLP